MSERWVTIAHVSSWLSWTCQDVFGYTSLALASSVGHEGVVKLLLAGSTDQSVSVHSMPESEDNLGHGNGALSWSQRVGSRFSALDLTQEAQVASSVARADDTKLVWYLVPGRLESPLQPWKYTSALGISSRPCTVHVPPCVVTPARASLYKLNDPQTHPPRPPTRSLQCLCRSCCCSAGASAAQSCPGVLACTSPWGRRYAVMTLRPWDLGDAVACVCVCIYIYRYAHTHAHTHTHIYIYIYIYIYICVCVCVCVSQLWSETELQHSIHWGPTEGSRKQKPGIQ